MTTNILFMQSPLEVQLPSFHLRRRALDSQRDCKTHSVYLVRHKARPSHRIGELSTKLALTEPVGGSSPKFTLKSSVSALKTLSGNPFEFSCPAQGSPIPSFRSVFSLFSHLQSPSEAQPQSSRLTQKLLGSSVKLTTHSVCPVRHKALPSQHLGLPEMIIDASIDRACWWIGPQIPN